ncbi:MAG: DnaB-like helicase C-terminal domain-containing protein [Candidatus Ozemobacteraceae bacterium]
MKDRHNHKKKSPRHPSSVSARPADRTRGEASNAESSSSGVASASATGLSTVADVRVSDRGSTLAQFLGEMSLDEENILANMAFDPLIAGKQLQEKHFGPNDFQGIEANRMLLSAMLSALEAEETVNVPNLYKRLTEEQKGGKTKLEWIGGGDRLQKLFTSPFSTPGVSKLEDLDPVIDRIRDRNTRSTARRLLVQYGEKVLNTGDDVFESLSGCLQDLRTLFLEGSTGYIRNLGIHLEEMRDLILANRERKRDYIGFETSFPILQERLSGMQKEFYLVTGGVGMGKSTFLTQLAWDLANMNPELTVLFFTLDLNRIDISAKLVAQAGEVPIDYVKNPYVTNPELEQRRQIGLAKVARMGERLFVIDESSGRIFLDDIKKLVKRTKLERGGEVAVVIDPIFKIHLKQDRMGFTEKCNFLSAELKSISAVEGITLIASAGLPRAISNRRPVREDLEEIMGLLYDPYVVFFLYCDYLNDFETPFLEWQWGKDNFMIPITELFIAKNKMGSINTRIFYRYFESYSRFKECAPQECENYSAMIENLQKFKDDKNVRDRGGQSSGGGGGGGGSGPSSGGGSHSSGGFGGSNTSGGGRRGRDEQF